MRAFAMLATYRRNQALAARGAGGQRERAAADVAAARAIVDPALADGRDAARRSRGQGAACRPTASRSSRRSPSTPGAPRPQRGGGELGYPVALKILSPDISHKSDVGGVALDLARRPRELRDAADRDAGAHRAPRMPAGAPRPASPCSRWCAGRCAQELIVGASVDPLFGPVLLFGQGGTAVEVIADRAIALPPLNRALARELVSRTRVARLLAGYRDHPPARLDAICDVLIALSQMLADLPELAELDINPLWADHEGVIALDARVRLEPRPAGPARRASRSRPIRPSSAETVDWHGEAIAAAAHPPRGRAAAPRLRRAAAAGGPAPALLLLAAASCRAASWPG